MPTATSIRTLSSTTRSDARDVNPPDIGLLFGFPPGSTGLGRLSKKLGGKLIVPDITGGAFGERLKENNPDRMIDAPLLIAQGLEDVVVYPALTNDYVERRCAPGSISNTGPSSKKVTSRSSRRGQLSLRRSSNGRRTALPACRRRQAAQGRSP